MRLFRPVVHNAGHIGVDAPTLGPGAAGGRPGRHEAPSMRPFPLEMSGSFGYDRDLKSDDPGSRWAYIKPEFRML